jgi:hypothetical protein
VLKKRGQPSSGVPLRTMTLAGMGVYQTRDQISGSRFLMPFVLFAAARRLQVAWEGPRYPRRSSLWSRCHG